METIFPMLEVMTEMGRKNVDRTFDVDAICGQILRDIELGLVQPQEKAAWLVERYGSAINFASVSPADVVPVDAIRRGLHRKAYYSYMTERQKKAA